MKIVPPNQLIPQAVEPLKWEDFKNHFESLGGFSQENHYCVAVSGGSDSLALTFLMHRWCTDQSLRFSALTVDHSLRPESAQEAAQVHIWLTSQGISHHILQWAPSVPKVTSAEARDARYHLLLDWCKKNQANSLLTAHHQDDQAETLVMRLSEGSGVDGLAGIAPVIETPFVKIVRPLLPFSKASLEGYLKDQDHAWIEDPSNQANWYKRARIRNFLKEEGLSTARIALMGKKMQQAREYLEQETTRWLTQYAKIHKAGFWVIALEPFRQTHPELQTRILNKTLKQMGGKIYPPRSQDLANLLTHFSQQISPKTLHGCFLSLWKGKLLISREERAIEKVISLEKGQFIRWDNRFNIWVDQADLSIAPLGELNWASIRKNVNKTLATSIPACVKPTLPAFYKENKIVAVPSLAFNPEKIDIKIEFLAVEDLFTPIFTIA